MQIANNTNNYTVEGLVAKYRNFVMEHCPKTYEVFDYVDEKGRFHAEDAYIPVSPDANAEEQLLAVVYASVAGKNANTEIVEALSKYSDKFCEEALQEDEFSYLCSNFSEFVSYTFDHKSEWFMRSSTEIGLSKERLRLVNEFIHPQNGSTVFIADTEHCEQAIQFPGCVIKGFTGWSYNHKEVWALGEIRMFAADIKSEIVAGEEVNEKYTYQLPPKGSVDYLIFRNCENKYFAQQIFGTECSDINALYDLLKPEGKMILFAERKRELAGKGDDELHNFIKRIVKDKTVEAIVSYEDKHLFLRNRKDEYILLVISKSPCTKFLVKNEITSFCQEFDMTYLDDEILWPGYYAAQRPQNGIPLSNIVSLKELRKGKTLFQENEKGDWILPESMANVPVAVPAIMTKEYKDANLNMTKLWSASDPSLENWEDEIRLIDKPCVLLYGKNDKCVIGYINETHDEGMATLDSVICLQPNEGVDVRYVATLLLLPEVKDQIISICSGEVNERIFSVIFDKVIVPNHTDKERFAFLAEANYNALISSQEEMKKNQENYILAVRMRKHALSQSLSSMNECFTSLNKYRLHNGGKLFDLDKITPITDDTVKTSFDFLSTKFAEMMPLVDRLADIEYSFGTPEWIDPEQFIENYITQNCGGWLSFKAIMSWEKGDNRIKNDMRDPESGEIVIHKGDAISKLHFPPKALNQVLENIISNAKEHGFTDRNREDYQIRFSWHEEGTNLVVEIENNGAPIPNDYSTSKLLEYGVSSKLHENGHNGIGCNEIDNIMHRYNGGVEIISSPDKEYTVKYILTFKSNTIISF